MRRSKTKQLRIKGGVWVSRGKWTPVYVHEHQTQPGTEWQVYALDANGVLVWAGVSRHVRMNQAIANQIQKVWFRWRREYDSLPENVANDYPAKHCTRVASLVVFPIDSPQEQQRFSV